MEKTELKTYRKDRYYINKDCGRGMRSEVMIDWFMFHLIWLVSALGISKIKYRKMKGCNVLRHDKEAL